MKDESQWIKIPDHHPAVISKDLFAQVQARRTRFKCPKKNTTIYPLRGKVFCGCCRHAMTRTANKNASFYCRYTKVNETATCHGLVIGEAELAREVAKAGGLSAELADTLIDRVYVYPGNQVEIAWKIKDFCIE